MNAYVVFKKQESVETAVKLNGKTFRDRHIRVDTVAEPKHDYKNTIFVGNIPFTAGEEQLWKAFTQFGVVKNVRIVRDNRTQKAKGVAYITFESKEQRVKAVAGNVEMEGRVLRIKKATSKQKLEKKDKSRAIIIQEKMMKRKAAEKPVFGGSEPVPSATPKQPGNDKKKAEDEKKKAEYDKKKVQKKLRRKEKKEKKEEKAKKEEKRKEEKEGKKGKEKDTKKPKEKKKEAKSNKKAKVE